MTARDAKTHFGEFLDTMQREPVIVTKNNRPVGIMLSIQDAADTLIPEMFMDKEGGYDAWFEAKIGATLKKLDGQEASTSAHAEVMHRAWSRVQANKKTDLA